MGDIIYKPKIKKIDMTECVDDDKFRILCKDINSDERLSLGEQRLLKTLATRFITFKYEKLADYYANANLVMKEWLERLNCVIVDDNRAIELGYFKYFADYNKLLGEIVNEE